jgi:branched-chain amino acid transport system substrate-binding protein
MVAATALGFGASSALAADPIKIGVIAEAQAIAGASIPQAAQLAAEEINAKGGIDGRKIEIVSYDNHSSSADSVRAFQRAVNEDKVNAVIASYISEVVLALMPWASRLKTPFVTPGAASNEITKAVNKDYEKNKYTFHGYLTSGELAQSVCDAAKDLLVDARKMKTAVIMSEDAAWTKPLDVGYQECLPKVGLKVLDHIRFSPDTTDFTPIFNKIEGSKPDVIITGISHVGVQPTVQWKNQQVPIPMFGIASQATNETFGKDTNNASDGVLYQGVSGPGVAVTSKSVPFAENFKKKYGNYPSYAGYTAYDEVYYIAEAVKRAGSTEGEKLKPQLLAELLRWTLRTQDDLPRAAYVPKRAPHGSCGRRKWPKPRSSSRPSSRPPRTDDEPNAPGRKRREHFCINVLLLTFVIPGRGRSPRTRNP